MADNALQPWAPSTWQPGMPATSVFADTSGGPMPSADQINAQRLLIQQRLRQYGYQPQQLSDADVLKTMTNIPQAPVQYPGWVMDYFKQNNYQQGGPTTVSRPGVDMPFNQTFEPYNLANHGISGSTPTKVGYAVDTEPRAAQIAHYGQAAVDNSEAQWLVDHSTPGTNVRVVNDTNPGGYDARVPGSNDFAQIAARGRPPGASSGGIPLSGAAPNALQPSAGGAVAPPWAQQMQQQSPSLWQALMRWMGITQQQQQPADGSGGGFVGGGGGPRYTIGNAPAIPQARPLTYSQ